MTCMSVPYHPESQANGFDGFRGLAMRYVGWIA